MQDKASLRAGAAVGRHEGQVTSDLFARNAVCAVRGRGRNCRCSRAQHLLAAADVFHNKKPISRKPRAVFIQQ